LQFGADGVHGGLLPVDVVVQPVVLLDGQLALLGHVDLVQLVQFHLPFAAEGLQLPVEPFDGESRRPPCGLVVQRGDLDEFVPDLGEQAEVVVRLPKRRPDLLGGTRRGGRGRRSWFHFGRRGGNRRRRRSYRSRGRRGGAKRCLLRDPGQRR